MLLKLSNPANSVYRKSGNRSGKYQDWQTGGMQKNVGLKLPYENLEVTDQIELTKNVKSISSFNFTLTCVTRMDCYPWNIYNRHIYNILRIYWNMFSFFIISSCICSLCNPCQCWYWYPYIFKQTDSWRCSGILNCSVY